jgi:hypothetical protein
MRSVAGASPVAPTRTDARSCKPMIVATTKNAVCRNASYATTPILRSSSGSHRALMMLHTSLTPKIAANAATAAATFATIGITTAPIRSTAGHTAQPPIERKCPAAQCEQPLLPCSNPVPHCVPPTEAANPTQRCSAGGAQRAGCDAVPRSSPDTKYPGIGRQRFPPGQRQPSGHARQNGGRPYANKSAEAASCQRMSTTGSGHPSHLSE